MNISEQRVADGKAVLTYAAPNVQEMAWKGRGWIAIGGSRCPRYP
jgi:hypothetical protein